MDKQNTDQSFSGILFSNKKAWNIDTCHDVDKSQKNNAKWKKAGADHILYDSIYMKCTQKANLEREREREKVE